VAVELLTAAFFAYYPHFEFEKARIDHMKSAKENWKANRAGDNGRKSK